MLALTKRTSYGLIAMTHLASLGQGKVSSARGIAQQYGIPVSLLSNVLKELARVGYVESTRGSRGGYRLARTPEQVNLGDLVSSLEGRVRLAECVTNATDEHTECTCQLMARCPIADPVHRVNRKLQDYLRKMTLAEVVDPALAAAREEMSGLAGGE